MYANLIQTYTGVHLSNCIPLVCLIQITTNKKILNVFNTNMYYLSNMDKWAPSEIHIPANYIPLDGDCLLSYLSID